MVYLICQATFLSGVLTGMILVIVANHPCVILKDQVRAVAVFCGALLGSTMRTTCVQLTATATIRRIPSTTTVFVVCQDFRTAGPFTPVRAVHGLYRFTTVGIDWPLAHRK